MEWYLKVMKNYVGFSGRARRQEYWMFFLINLLITVVLNCLALVSSSFAALGGLYGLAVFIPTLAVLFRRLHDTGKSGWWFLLAFIPLANFVLIYFLCVSGTPGDNQYGPDPKAEMA